MDSNFDDKLTLIDRLAEHAVLSPTKASYVFLTDSAAAQEIDFRDLRARVAVIAAALADRFAPGERVLLLLPTGLEFIVAFLASLEAGLIAVPGYPPRQRRSSERLRAMLSDAAPAVALVSDKDNAAVAELVRDREPGLAVLSLDDLKAVGSTVSRVSPTRRNRIAFLQYTSGSTGRPRGNLLTLNAMTAAHAVLVPVQCEFFALEGISQLKETIDQIRGTLNPGLEIQGVVLTMHDARTHLSREVADNVRAFFGSKVYETMIPRNTRVAEAPSHGKPILLYDYDCAGSQAYIRLATEIIERERRFKAA